ncbi:aminopeptidase P family protein [Maribius pontilimi]|uniref:Aminopeptidase P family protein n=1 Tax=Palleronia pontilimi TaxID=1964209 RepID=A0A934IJW3_9RHOB|nr:Xaa-Pro peptidase family protein [Palleronia pontilimi]MBJ3763304.1 aminopeptidase P family protein [Palleronia pontilimi]
MTPRGFAPDEIRARATAAQDLMARARIDALLLTTEPEIRYFTGFLTRFWESPTRPWFVVLPQGGDPIAVIPSIGAELMARAGVNDIRTWPSPRPGDDGTTLLAATLNAHGPRIGLPMGDETHLRMPLAQFDALRGLCPALDFTHDAGITRTLRMVKSDAEIAKIATACAIADRAFARVPDIAAPGVPLATVFRDFQALCLAEGADTVPYLAGAAGQGGYDDVISPATDAPLMPGDVLMLDTGLTFDGYFCDFDRNFALGDTGLDADHDRLVAAVEAGRAAAMPGARASDVHAAMRAAEAPAPGAAVRLGHGLGMQLTEWPSLSPFDQTVLQAGMVLTLEPCVATEAGRILVLEENIVLTETGNRALSTPATRMVRL